MVRTFPEPWCRTIQSKLLRFPAYRYRGTLPASGRPPAAASLDRHLRQTHVSHRSTYHLVAVRAPPTFGTLCVNAHRIWRLSAGADVGLVAVPISAARIGTKPTTRTRTAQTFLFP